jgi:5-methylcytosine-specific restriction endonuclease McrA
VSAPRELLTEEQRTFLQCALAARDGRRCFYCGRNFKKRSRRRKTLDHYVPHRYWPGWQLENLVLACEGCNAVKADRLPWPLVWLLLAAFRQADWGLAA